MTKKELVKRINNLTKPTKIVVVLFFVFLVATLGFNLLFWERVFPQVSIAGIDVGGKNNDEIVGILKESVDVPETLILAHEDQVFDLDLSVFEFEYDFEASSQRALGVYRTGNVFYDFWQRWLSLFNKKTLGVAFNLNEESLTETLAIIVDQISIEPVEPSAYFYYGNLITEIGEKGTTIDKKALRIQIGEILSYARDEKILLESVEVDPSLSPEQEKAYRQRAQSFAGKSLTLEFEYQTFSYYQNDLLVLIDPIGGYNEEKVEALTTEVSDEVNRDPQNPVFVFKNNRVEEFLPAKDGAKVNVDTLQEMVLGNLKTLETTDEKTVSLSIPITKTESTVKTEEVNDLGINQLIGRGSSTYYGSIASRIHNIGVASARFNGVLVSPGETFSFNQILGDVSSYTGYKQAYIIKDGQTVLGDGGGVCQVSTTLFRAVLDAGLPVVERRSHSYRVGYYEQDSLPGLDATIYSPTTDLKFQNDTPGHLLIQVYYEPRNASLIFEIYGTDDGRVATTSKPLVSNVSSPPEDLYIDDPNLPAGTIEQIEYKAWGASVKFNYTVQKDGEAVYEKTFYSNYRPWQAKFLRGTGPAN